MSASRARVTCWGVRGTCPSPGARTVRYGGNTSCVDVQLANGARVILDAGTGIRALGQSLPAAAPSVAGARPVIAVVLTHRHSDHVIGLAHFAPIITRSHHVRMACGGVDAVSLRALVDQQLSAPLFPTLAGITDALSVDAFDADGVFHLDDSCTVHTLPARHPGGASVLRVDDAAGAVMAFAPDNELSYADDDSRVTAWRAELALSLRGIPVLLHDATYTNEELSAHRGWGHSSAEEATRFAMECGAGTLLLTHHHPDRTDDEVDAMEARCREIVANAGAELRVAAATEGEVLAVV
ncbi:MAG: MBL fold metallo-hydrolase [Gemmatimonadaceae bacterium]|nr:MBL fold metallo-hydrolase [Gemmatimonadaceae bacterium]